MNTQTLFNKCHKLLSAVIIMHRTAQKLKIHENSWWLCNRFTSIHMLKTWGLDGIFLLLYGTKYLWTFHLRTKLCLQDNKWCINDSGHTVSMLQHNDCIVFLHFNAFDFFYQVMCIARWGKILKEKLHSSSYHVWCK